jgi:hypothetical protein
VQKGKFAACAFALLSALNKVDFPTFGNPTIPACNAIAIYDFRFLISGLKRAQK